MKPFTVLGYSANDEVFCPACLRSTTGLGPSDTDYNGRPILPLYAADTTVQEERCTYCGSSLLELKAASEAQRDKATPAFQVEKTRHHGGRPRAASPGTGGAVPAPRRRAAALPKRRACRRA